MSENPLNLSSVCEVPEVDLAVYPRSAMSNHTNSTNLCRLDLDSVNRCVLWPTAVDTAERAELMNHGKCSGERCEITVDIMTFMQILNGILE